MDLSKYAALFLTESREHLGACNQLLLDWERDPTGTEPVGGLFRAIHTIKGMAATMGYEQTGALAHRMETLLDAVRSGQVPPTASLVDLLLRSVDVLEEAVEAAAGGGDEGLGDVSALVKELDQAARGQTRARKTKRPARKRGRKAAATEPEEAAGGAPGSARLVTVTMRPDTAMRGARALLALRRVEQLGPVHDVRPPAATFDQTEFSGRFTCRLHSAASDAAVAEAVRAAGEVAQVDVAAGDAAVAASSGGVEALRHIRVELSRLDTLMNRVGELVLERNRLALLAAQEPGTELEALSGRISRLVTDLQSNVIQARMTPLWQAIDRFPRVVRDLARQLDKQVAYSVEGEDIELDRAVLDEIGEPVLHLLRNAVDHGLETSAERVAAGKPAQGKLVLAATREGNSVALRIRDDGRGIDRDRILAKAQRDGTVEAGVRELPDDQLLRVLARAGFSTAQRISSVSGRGVGIDVVVTRLRALGGSVELTSRVGEGTTFTLRLPFTMAIQRALLAQAGAERYLVPTTYVAETVDYEAQALTEVRGREAIVLRDRVIPTVHLRALLGVTEGVPSARRPGLILELGDRRAALVVDGLLGQQEVVVEPFSAPRGTPPLFSGATILADGAPALILDAAALV